MTKNDLLAAALQLPASERASLARELLETLDADEELSPEEWAQDWGDEIDRRLASLEDGSAQLVPAEDVFAKARARLDKTRAGSI